MGTVTGPWTQLLINALESNVHLKHSSFFQLATIGSNGRPSNRTLVFRGFQENSDRIQINTDCRTHKIEELKHCPFAEICWYFTDSWEQFRINGKIDIIDASDPDPNKLQQREKSWFASSPKSRLQYLGPNPGLPCLSDQPDQEFLDPSTGPVGAFCVLILDPDQVDYLNLKSNQRVKFTSGLSVNGEKCWTSERFSISLGEFRIVWPSGRNPQISASSRSSRVSRCLPPTFLSRKKNNQLLTSFLDFLAC